MEPEGSAKASCSADAEDGHVSLSKPLELDLEANGPAAGPSEAASRRNEPGSALRQPRRLAVVFQRVSLEVRVRRGRQRHWQPLLAGVSGYVRPGELTAVMGPSGSGKSTLLDLLAGRKTSGRLNPDSQMMYNGKLPTSSLLRRDVGFVEQHETLLSLLTPAEMLLYTAELKHPRSMGRPAKQRLVDALVEKLALEDCQHTPIGSSLHRGISGGEAKRTNVGLAMISHPALLLCDEATSGLDSWNAHSVVAALRELAADGIAICGTIHSPPPDTFALFDRVLVLQRGRVVYFGPNGPPCAAYFHTTFPQLRPMRLSEGLADFIIDVTTSANKQGEAAAAAFAEAYAASQLAADNQQQAAALLAEAATGTATSAAGAGAAVVSHRSAGGGSSSGNSLSRGRSRRSPLWEPGRGQGSANLNLAGRLKHLLCLDRDHSAGTSTPWWFGLAVLVRYRALRSFSRPSWVLPRALSPLIPVFLLATVYWGMGKNLDIRDVTSIAGILFMWTVSCAYGSMGIVPTLVMERAVYLRERADGLYRPLTYLLYKLAEELPVPLAISLPYSCLVFYLVRLQGSLALFWMVFVVSTANSIALALLVGALSPSVDIAGAALPAYTTSLLYFSGFLITWSNIPPYWIWYSVIDYLRYSWGALMVNQFEGARNIAAYGGIRVLQYFDLEHVNKWHWLGWEALFAGVFACLAWAALALIRHQQR